MARFFERVCVSGRPRPERDTMRDNPSQLRWLRDFLRSAGNSAVVSRPFQRFTAGNAGRRHHVGHVHLGDIRAAKARNRRPAARRGVEPRQSE